MRSREVGTLWIGGRLSWMEQLCLKSFVDAGQRITLFSYDDIPNVPEGVIRRDGREILDTDDFIKYEKKNSFALFADLFRLHMIKKNPGMIWIDTDVYCHRPMDYDSDYVFGYELPDSNRVNNAVLGLPADSDILNAMLDFTSDRFSIAPFLPEKMQKQFRKAAKDGKPVHVSQQPWGVWGPLMITHYVHEYGLTDQVKPLPAFYPVTFRERRMFLKPVADVDALVTDDTTALHYWASNKRELGNLYHGLPPKGSWFQRALELHGINPALAPIAARNTSSFEGELFDDLADQNVRRFADIGGTARSLALSLNARDDCEILLVDIDRSGNFPESTSAWVGDYTSFLIEQGVEPARIRVAQGAADLVPSDVVASLNYFGHSAKIKNIRPAIDGLLHTNSLLFLDIRRGSGGFPFLRALGTSETLRQDGDVARVRFVPDPSKLPVPAADVPSASPAQLKPATKKATTKKATTAKKPTATKKAATSKAASKTTVSRATKPKGSKS